MHPGCQSPFPKPCPCNRPRSGPGTDPRNRACLSEEGRGRRWVRSGECPPRAAFSLGTVCFCCIFVPGTQLLSNWIKLSQNAGTSLLAQGRDGAVSPGGLSARRGVHVVLTGDPLSLSHLVGCPKDAREFGPHAWQTLHRRQGTQAASPLAPALADGTWTLLITTPCWV